MYIIKEVGKVSFLLNGTERRSGICQENGGGERIGEEFARN
jgi:hypothetical protein